jgi:hypothetical protein
MPDSLPPWSPKIPGPTFHMHHNLTITYVFHEHEWNGILGFVGSVYQWPITIGRSRRAREDPHYIDGKPNYAFESGNHKQPKQNHVHYDTRPIPRYVLKTTRSSNRVPFQTSPNRWYKNS